MKELVGSWISDPCLTSSDKYEKVRMDFSSDGKLLYTIIGQDTDQLIFLTYRIEGDMIISNQPSHPREENKTRFLFTSDGKLVLIYEDEMYRYVRYSEQ